MALSGEDARAEPTDEWSLAPGLVVLAWVATAAAAAWCVATWVLGGDAPGRLLSSVAVVAMVVAAVFGSRARPRLRADAYGVTVGGLLRARHTPWPLVRDVRVLPVRRLGISGALLEIDTMNADGDEQLLVFGRLDLGADPQDVAPRLAALRPGRSPR